VRFLTPAGWIEENRRRDIEFNSLANSFSRRSRRKPRQSMETFRYLFLTVCSVPTQAAIQTDAVEPDRRGRQTVEPTRPVLPEMRLSRSAPVGLEPFSF
jgi:hypothetical protein